MSQASTYREFQTTWAVSLARIGRAYDIVVCMEMSLLLFRAC